ncbi:class I SAM-dependent methyltransferase [Chamaesiphon minutus]|uniref:Methylase involved in ubiquinone/menaquinone biosynthesis n=1 Tax=Chamaesiphon minutus (strain ATCC 27169 / PCC 6605) TaxID=1173020 RepID=K9URD3_CHAP6|nr:class I SAM-dependent methyltransferase [Chamaesiphon minutus]AFY96794.1 methylase involved in ubiquinone/menaquinone biosynthesis [Chamaesiphon minutus PCC 6605]
MSDAYSYNVEQIKEHYELEKSLAKRLRNSTKQERQYLYTELYDELFTKIYFLPQLSVKADPAAAAWIVAQRMQLIESFLIPDLIFLEIGPGDCTLSLEITKHVKKVYALDVSNEITKNLAMPDNFELIISDGCSIPLPDNSVNLAYSHQLMEHLHPDDAVEQLQAVCRTLVPGGTYICITPNRLSGPHDVSQYFDEVATGFHLKEYLLSELYQLFCTAGFSKVSLYKSYKTTHLQIPLSSLTMWLFVAIESFLQILPFPLRRKIASLPMLFRGMTVVGVK